MASWMIHLRVADRLIDRLEGICPQEFIMGSMAPDSGVPNADWSKFTPDKKTSHFNTVIGGKKVIDIEKYLSEYFTADDIKRYGREEYSFFLGYLAHLLTDIEWIERVYDPCCQKYSKEYEQDKVAFTWKIKEDWYDLDFLYLKNNPDFRAFDIFRSVKDFENTYMDIFSKDAFQNRKEYIVEFYSEEKENLEREYLYFTEDEAEKFVTACAESVYNKLLLYK